MCTLSAPYKRIAPGGWTGWASAVEMCQEIFRDLEVPWVQDFMLDSRPRQDAILSLRYEQHQSHEVDHRGGFGHYHSAVLHVWK